jgi:hypothetical protein
MTTTSNLYSSSATRCSDQRHELAVQLYALISSGHDGLAFNVDARGPGLIVRGPNGERRAVRIGGEGAPPWQRARELRDGVERDRRFNPWVLEQHVIGRYSVAPAAPGWVQWVCIDIDAHRRAGESELVARLRARRMLGRVWRALGCSAERHPLLLRSPGGGYHVWLPLTRGATSTNPEHTWPAAVARAWVERHLVAAGLELRAGDLEIYPSGRCLRAPCGRGMVMLQATGADDPDVLGLVPWPGTAEGRIDWAGERDDLTTWSRHVVPMVRAFLAQWEIQRRTLSDWLGRPEAAWDPAWGFLGWRDAKDVENVGEIFSSEKNSGADLRRQESRSQESDDVPVRHQAGGTPIVQVGQGRAGRSRKGKRSESPINEDQLPPAAPEVDLPPDPAVGPLVRGRAFFEKVRRLLWQGVTEASTRHDAVLTLAFYWAGTCGLPIEQALARLEAWCRAHPHLGSRLASCPRELLADCVREARNYIEHYASRWRFRGRGHAGGLATLTPADQAVIGAVDARVVVEVATILAWLAGRADGDGRIADPVQISARLLIRLCGDRRIDVDGDGKRRRTTAFALTELERVGVLTMASNYRRGQRGRLWACWYRFGSGELARSVSLPAGKWAEIDPSAAAPLVPTLPTLEVVAPSAPRQDIASAPIVEVRVLGERVVPEGLLRVLSDGARGVPRTLLTLAPEVQCPTAAPAARAPWFVRAYLLRPFTPGRLWSSDPAMVIAFPDLEARRKMSRRERIAWGGGGGTEGGGVAPVVPLRAPAVPSSPTVPSSPIAAPAAAVAPGLANRTAAPQRSVEELRAELAAEVGAELAAALPIDLLEVTCRAWGGHRRRARGP